MNTPELELLKSKFFDAYNALDKFKEYHSRKLKIENSKYDYAEQTEFNLNYGELREMRKLEDAVLNAQSAYAREYLKSIKK